MINLSFDRPKLNQTVSEDVTVDVATPVINGSEIEIRFFLDNVQIDDIVLTDLSIEPITWVAGGTTISGGLDTFKDVRVGDVITSTSGTDFASGQIVTDVSVSFNSIEVDQPIDGDADSGQAGSSLTFTPGVLDTTLYILKLDHVINDTTLYIRPEVSRFDGSRVAEGLTDDDSDDLPFAEGNKRKLATLRFDLDSYLTNARVSRVDS